MKVFYRTEQVLTNENIETILDDLTDMYLKTVERDAYTRTEFQLALEEVLIGFRDHWEADKPCRILFYKRFGTYSISLSQAGQRKPVYWDQVSEFTVKLLTKLDVFPRYVYSREDGGRNKVICGNVVKEKKHSLLGPILIAAVLAVAVGIGLNCLPADVHRRIAVEFVSPLLDKLTGILSAVATPLVFLAVIGGIMSIGDVRVFGKIGKSVILRMGMSYLIAGLLAVIACMAMFGLPLLSSASSGTSAPGQVFQLVLDMFPSNLFMAFANGNDLQVIMIAIFVGIVILILGNKLRVTRDLISEGSDLINMMMKLCCKLLPLIVFCGVANLVINSDAGQVYSIIQMLIIFLVAATVFVVFTIIRTRLTVKTPLKYILPKQLPTLLINLTTSSQVAALPENMKCCKEKFGIDSKLADFALPLGIVVFMPCGAVCFIAVGWGIMALTGLPVTIGIAVQIMLVGIVVAVAAPPIPGSALVVMPIVFASCGIPGNMLPLAIIFGTVVGYILPALNGFLLQQELLMTAKKLKMADEKTLNSPYTEKPAEA